MLAEEVEDCLGRLFDRLVAGVHNDLGALWHLVGVAGAGELRSETPGGRRHRPARHPHKNAL